MPGSEQWRERLALAAARGPMPKVVAQTPIARRSGYSKAAVARCSDGELYVVKGTQVGRALVADQVVGRLAAVMGAPVPEVALVDVPADLVADQNFYMGHFEAGIGHGSRIIPGCEDGWDIEHEDAAENRDRFALLAVLFGVAFPDDQQFMYRKAPPRIVYSVDHGHFFAGAPDWTIETLVAAPIAEPDSGIVSYAGISPDAISMALERLRNVSDEVIAGVVAAPPDA